MSTFKFKHFEIIQQSSAMKVGTDAMVLGAFVQKNAVSTILDVGSGTGVIGLMLAQKFQDAHVLGIELDEDAANECKINYDRSPWTDRMEVVKANVRDIRLEMKFDLIVSNPPFFHNALQNSDQRSSLARHVNDLTPDLFGNFTKAHLTEAGETWMIIPFQDSDLWIEAFSENGLHLKRQISISGVQGAEPNRSVLVFSLQPHESIHASEFTIRREDGKYTDEYIELTKAYHGVPLK